MSVQVTLTLKEAEIVASVLRERNGATLNDIANRIDAATQIMGEECIHPGMFSGDAPRYEFGHPEGGEFYAAWLDSTKRCHYCGADVKMRDL